MEDTASKLRDQSDHIPVLFKEVIEGLNLQPDDVVVDATVNGGGHAHGISQQLSTQGVLVGIDQDQSALEVSKQHLDSAQCVVHLVHSNFKDLTQALGSVGLSSADKFLFDLGWSTNQFQDPTRGFSFMSDGPLDMRLDQSHEGPTAADIVNGWPEEELANLIYQWGEEKRSRKIAKAITEARRRARIVSTLELADIVASVLPKGKIHPATQTFQALRIQVNDEFGALEKGLRQAFQLLNPGGRIAVITFHSLEDRAVKRMFRQASVDYDFSLVNKKPITASRSELHDNPRSRSAKLRIIQAN